MKSAVEFREVSLQLGGKSVLDGLSFTVDEGEKAVITGPSGVGKTTVIRIMTGFQVPDEGEVTLFDERISEQTLQSIRSKIFWLPQHFNPGNGIVGDFLDSIFSFRKNQDLRPTNDEMVETFRSLLLPEDILQRKAETLSGGQLQRVGLGIGLLIDRQLVLLDEPTSQLDDKAKEKVAEQYLARAGMTLISASHDPAWNKNMNQNIELFE